MAADGRALASATVSVSQGERALCRALVLLDAGDADVVRRLLAAIEAVAVRASDERPALMALVQAIRAEARAKAAAFDVADIDASAGPWAQGSGRET